MGDKWTNDKLKTNCVAFDKHAKEYVMVSNGKCTLDHSTPEAFKFSHQHNDGTNGCFYEASEAIALRPFVESDSVLIAWTYRKVNQEDLQVVPEDTAREQKFKFDAVLSGTGKKPKVKVDTRFIGRI